MTENRPNKGRDNCLKSWRIMVRNLPFDTKSNELREAYGKYGELLEINLPKCRDKKFPNSCAGFCFLQFAKRKNAEFAFVAINKAPFKGRSVSAQWAIDKDTFVTQKSAGKERQIIEQKLKKILYGDESKRPNTRRDKKSTRHNENGAVKNEIKEEVSSADENNEAEESFLSARSNATTKTETDDEDFEDENESENEEEEVGDEDEENKSLLKSELEFDDEDENEDSLNSLSDEEIHDDDEDNRKTPKVKGKKMNKSTDIANSQRKEDVAVAEGRVVFLKNVDFNATSELLKEVASKFGEVALAIQCKYPGTDQPTGSAFIHFCEKSAADAFLNELPKSPGVEVNGRQVFGYRAVSRETASTEFAKSAKREPKDRRNLHLLRASLIRDGTAQARGMSDEDAEKRKRLVLLAKNKLKQLTMFVSPTRLAIHNIPFSMCDEELRAICLKAARNPNASITEARIMREALGRDERGRIKLGRSKGFGFVAFTKHADALSCLRTLNNNPETFTNELRPIVEFSIENLNAIRVKERRVQKPQSTANSSADGDKNAAASWKKKIKISRFDPTTSLADPAALAETKRELRAGGRKWLPKRVGEKIRHRDKIKKKRIHTN